jgi:DNA polymerase (family 10)
LVVFHGAKKALLLSTKLKIDSLEKLKAAAQAGKIRDLAGFGAKTEENILANMSFAAEIGKRMLITDARRIADGVIVHLKKAPFIQNVNLAGSARRWKETVGDLDFLCTSKKPEAAIKHFLAYAQGARVLAEGGTKASVILPTGLQCDFRVVDESSFGAALLYFTGSKEHNVRLREIAQQKGMTLNEYGLFKESDKNKSKSLAGRTEEEVYKKLGLAWVPPELREDRGEIQAALKDALPKLLEETDVRGDYHNHTTMSDGSNSLEEMVDAARAKKWKWFFSADHSPSLTVTNGLTVPRLRGKMKDVKKLDGKNGFHVYCSSEVDILQDGKMDYTDDVLADLDCVIASVHSRFNQPLDVMTERILKAISNPNVDILGHLSGRLINKRKSYELDYEAVLQKAKETQTAVEINGQPDRAELTDVHIKRAIELGVPLALNTDAHSTRELDNMTLAVHIARRGWAEAKHILNTKSAEEMIKWLAS